MDLKELKRQIYKDENIIPLLESLGCPYIKTEQSGKLITCGLPDGFNSTNKRTVQVKNNENLTAYIRSRNISGNIFNIVGYILYDCVEFEDVKKNLYQIVQYICNTLNYEPENFKSKKIEKKDWLYFLRPIQKERKKELTLDQIPENKPLNINVMEQYINYLHIDWYNQGITEETRKIFNIRFDLCSNRIVFPVHDLQGNIIGVKGRYIGEESEDIPKYIYLYPFHKSIELFNLHRAYKKIQETKKVIIFESEKACMLAWQWGYYNCLGLMGSDISPVQIYKLKKLGLDIEIIFMFDADKDWLDEEKTKQIKKQIKQIKNREIKVMYDRNKLLSKEGKESPTDKGKEVFEELLNKYTYKIRKST